MNGADVEPVIETRYSAPDKINAVPFFKMKTALYDRKARDAPPSPGLF